MTAFLRQKRLRWYVRPRVKEGYHQEDDNYADAGKGKMVEVKKRWLDNIRDDVKEYNIMTEEMAEKCGT